MGWVEGKMDGVLDGGGESEARKRVTSSNN